MSFIDKITADDKKRREDAQKRTKEQNDRFNKVVEERQRLTGQGEYGKGGSKDVRVEARKNAEAKNDALSQYYKDQPKKSLTVGKRNKDGSRNTSVSGERPTPPTDADIATRLPDARNKVDESYKRNEREQRQLQKYGRVLKPGESPHGKSNEPGFQAYRKVKEQAEKEGREIRGGVTVNTYTDGVNTYQKTTARLTSTPKPVDDNRKIHTEIASGANVESVAIPKVFGGPTIETYKLGREGLTDEQRAFVKSEEAKGNTRYSGDVTFDNTTGATSFGFINTSGSKEYKESLQTRNKQRFENKQSEAKFRQDAQSKGLVVTKTQNADGSYTLSATTPKGPDFNPNTGERVFRSTVGFGGEIVAGFIDLAGVGEAAIVEGVTGSHQKGVEFFGNVQKTTNKIRENTSLGALGNVYESIGNATGSENYKQAGVHAKEQAKVEKPVIDVIQAGGAGVAAAAGSAEGKIQVSEFIEQTQKRPEETIITTAIDAITFGGAGKLRGARVAKGEKGSIPFSSIKLTEKQMARIPKGETIKPTETGFAKQTKLEEILNSKENLETFKRLPDNYAARGAFGATSATKSVDVKDKPISVSVNEAKTSSIEAIKRATGETVKPSDVKVIKLKTVKTGNKYENVPTKKGEKATSYEVVNKENESLAVVTKKGVSVTTNNPLDITGASKAVGQKVGRSGKSFESVEKVNPDELYANQFTEYQTSEATGLRTSSFDKPGGVTKITDQSGKTRTLITDQSGELRAPKVENTDVLTYNTAQTLKAERESRITNSASEQVSKYHNTPDEIQKYLDKIPYDRQIRAKVAKTERLLEKPRQELSGVENELNGADEQIAAINAERASLDTGPPGVPGERAAKIQELNLKLQDLQVKRQKLIAKQNAINNRIKGISERRRLRRSDYLGARQRVYKEYQNRQDTPTRSLAKKRITKQSAPGFKQVSSESGRQNLISELKSPVKVVKTINKSVKESVIESAFEPLRERQKFGVIGIGGNATDYTNKSTLGLGGKTGYERKLKRVNTTDEPLFLTTPKQFNIPETGPKLVGTTKTGQKITDKSIVDNLFTPYQSEKIATSQDLTFKQTEKQIYRTGEGFKTIPTHTPPPTTVKYPPALLPRIGGGGGGFGLGPAGKLGVTKARKNAVANILLPEFSLTGAGEQNAYAEKALFGKSTKGKKKGKKVRSILDF